MSQHEIAPGVVIPVIGLGTWGMGGRQIEDHRWDKENITAIRMAIELGITHIDTAEYYGAGHAEELVGEAIEPYNRDELFITTKVWRTNLHFDDFIKSTRQSLKRLNLDYVDLLLIHWPNREIPLEETMSALEHCAEEGFTRYIGVSNFDCSLMHQAQCYLKEHHLVANQVEYSLMDQKPRHDLLPYIGDNDSTLIAYSPLAKGRLARKGSTVLDQIAEKYQKSPAQVALNWLIAQENVVAIPKSSNPIHILELMGAVDWELSLEDSLSLADSFI
ncbi:MAG: aldo/keto reductase [Candidatus Bathyarchaeota archaeon]|nr:aldo/keto reductase [Candidatus Bathyarchaeota archaeon]